MATTIFEAKTITLASGKKVELVPLKIKYLRKFMVEFDNLPGAMSDNVESIDVIMKCVAVALEQYDPELSANPDLLEEEFDLPTAYKVIEMGSGIKMTEDDDEAPKPQTAAEQNGES